MNIEKFAAHKNKATTARRGPLENRTGDRENLTPGHMIAGDGRLTLEQL
jgi:hypothetical protein